MYLWIVISGEKLKSTSCNVYCFPSHSLALVTGPASSSPTHYLDRDSKVLSVKSGAPPTAMFVLCVQMPGASLLEVIDSLRQNVSSSGTYCVCVCACVRVCVFVCMCACMRVGVGGVVVGM